MSQIIRVGMDTSKNVFQLHGVNAAEEVVLRRKLRRTEMVALFQNLPPTVSGLNREALSANPGRMAIRQPAGLRLQRLRGGAQTVKRLVASTS